MGQEEDKILDFIRAGFSANVGRHLGVSFSAPWPETERVIREEVTRFLGTLHGVALGAVAFRVEQDDGGVNIRPMNLYTAMLFMGQRVASDASEYTDDNGVCYRVDEGSLVITTPVTMRGFVFSGGIRI